MLFSRAYRKGCLMTALEKTFESVAVYEKRQFWKESFFYDRSEKLAYIDKLKLREVDVYHSVNEFSTARRSEATLKKLNYLYCDIDCHKGVFNEWVTLEILRSDYFGSKVPYPSLINNSGRGLHLYWVLENEGAESLSKWKALQQVILNNLSSISEETNCSVDFKCIDPSRVLRTTDTFNTKSKTKCRLIEETKLTYTLDDIFECFYGINPSDLKPFNMNPSKDKGNSKKTLVDAKNSLNERKEWTDIKVKHANGIVSLFNAYSLLTCRAKDLKKLLELRNGAMTGMRDDFLTKYAWTVISKKDDLEKVHRELDGINSLFKEPLSDKEVSYKAQYIYNRFNKQVVKDADISKMTDLDRYWFRNTTIIRDLAITSEEQKHMTTIISKEEKNRRKCENEKKSRRNENGLTKREQDKADNIAKVQECKVRGLSQSATKEETGLSLGSVRKYWNC